MISPKNTRDILEIKLKFPGNIASFGENAGKFRRNYENRKKKDMNWNLSGDIL